MYFQRCTGGQAVATIWPHGPWDPCDRSFAAGHHGVGGVHLAAVDLPRSTLSAQQAALMVLMAIMFAARRVVLVQALPLLQRFFAEAFGPWQRSAGFTALTSVLLC